MDHAPRRRKLWEVSSAYHCALLGTCVPMSALRRYARRASMAEAERASDYEVHHAAVHLAGERNALSKLLQKDLESRFAPTVARFAALESDAALLAAWKEALEQGEVAPALWALMTHPFVSSGLLQTASQDVHMLSHQVGATMRADLRRMSELQRVNAELNEHIERLISRHGGQLAERDARIAALEARLAQSAGVEQRLHDDLREMEVLRSRMQPATVDAERVQALARRLAEAESERAALQTALAETRAATSAAERALAELLSRHCARGGATPSRLSGHAVLYVGGRTGLVDQYRALFERYDGRFLHHDGGVEDSLKRLPPLLAGADAVVCGAGNVSHGAYYLAKRFCKQLRKPCVLMKTSGVSAFMRALENLNGVVAGGTPGSTVLHLEGMTGN
jgi:hypothetical protein